MVFAVESESEYKEDGKKNAISLQSTEYVHARRLTERQTYPITHAHFDSDLWDLFVPYFVP